MDAVEFFKTVNRLCKNQSGCEKCPVYKEGICMVMRMIRLDDDLVKSIEETVSKVEQWAKDHPIKTKTRQSEFLKMFPDTLVDEDDGVLCIDTCVIEKSIGCTNGKSCDDCRREYWLAEVTDDD